jgi:EAL domain-containing protein (putative c-di-GMP-specific phosphodiesterase class I)
MITEDLARVPHILIVDDEPTIVSVMERALSSNGCLVSSATTQAEAAYKLESMDFDVIVSDVRIGDGDGVDLLRRAHEHDADLPVIMITGLPHVDSAIRSVEHRAFRYLVKPFDLQELERIVRDAISTYRNAIAKRKVFARYQTESLSKKAMAANFTNALSSLFIMYQPIVRWSDRSVMAYEALLRSRESSLPHPSALLDAAEKLGKLHLLGRAIRNRVAAEFPRNPAELVFVNIHAVDLLDDALFDRAGALSRLASRVILEITERASFHQMNDLRARVDELRKLGFRIAIDDLGQGYAGLTSLAMIEPEVIKLDMSMVRAVDRSPPGRRLIRSMVAVARDSGAQLIAEGVETKEERDALLEIGCDLFQGYLFARPAVEFPTVAW